MLKITRKNFLSINADMVKGGGKNIFKKLLSKNWKIERKFYKTKHYITLFFKNKSEFKRQYKEREHRVCYGKENKDKIFYVIRRDVSDEGHYSVINFVVGGIYYANKMGYIPLVDMKNYYSPMWQSKENKYLENAWEYFYEQPSKYGLGDIANSKNVILSDMNYMPTRPDIYDYSKKDNSLWTPIYNNLIIPNKRLRKIRETVTQKMDLNNHRVMGVVMRRGIEWGYEMDVGKYKTYSKPVAFYDYINLIKAKQYEWNCDRIFVSIDDEESLCYIKNCFGDQLLYVNRQRKHYYKKIEGRLVPLSIEEKMEYDVKANNVNQNELFMREAIYSTETYVLSKCNSIIAEKTSSCMAAVIMNNGEFEHILMLDSV